MPWALTRHIDVFRSLADPIETALFTDGLKRVVQTKKDGAVSPVAGTAASDVMVVSGRVIFDPFGRTIEQFYPVTEPLGQAGTFNPAFDTVQPTRTTLDVLDRVTSVVIPDNTTTTTSYDFAPDRAGHTQFRTTVIDANNVRKEMFRDVRELITTVNEFNNGGAQVLRTSYAYDPLKQITTVTDNNTNLTRVEYDTFGRRTSIDSPDAGRTAFIYDLADNLTAQETANLRATGQKISYAYEFTRLKAISYPVFPENNVAYTYGPASLKGQPGNRVGRITKITDAAGTEERLYGQLGETVEEKRTIPLPGGQPRVYVTKYQFDTFNRLQVLTYPDNDTVVTYNYNSGGLVNRVSGTDSNASDVYVPRVNYDKFGQRLLVDFGNGARTSYAYDAKTRRIASVKASLPNGYTFHNLAFSYDKVGNLTQLKNNAIRPGDFPGPGLGNAIGGPWTKDYAYDQLYRLTTSAGQHQTNPNEVSTYTYDQTYDTIHNITRKNQVHQFKNSTQPDTTYDYTFTYPGSGSARPHGAVAIGPYDILHDANGNLTRQTQVGTSDIVHYVYDEENRLACVHKGQQVPNPSCQEKGTFPAEFVYDHAGVRKRKDAGQPTFYPNQFLTDIGGGAGGQFKHIFLGAMRILTMKVIPPPDKQQWYYHADHLGSTSIVTNEKAQLAEHTHYFPYGEVWLQERPSTPVPYLFSSKEFDSETGLYDFGARYLNPRFAQWMTTDPALGDYVSGSNGGVHLPPNLALYGYSFNNPSTLTDPDGQFVPLLLVAAAISLIAQTQYANAPTSVDTPIKSRSEGEMLASGAVGALAGPLGGAAARGTVLLSQKAAVTFPRLTTLGTEVLAGEVGIIPPAATTLGVTAAGVAVMSIHQPGALRHFALAAHNLVAAARSQEAHKIMALRHSAVAIAEVVLPNGKRTFFAAGNMGTLSKAQRDLLKEAGVPEANILAGSANKRLLDLANPIGSEAHKLANHAERIIERGLPEGSRVLRWGISKGEHKLPEACASCLLGPVTRLGGTIERDAR